MQRFRLRVGDKSSIGGTVTEGIPAMKQAGVPLTFLGASVSCPVCNSTGKITPTGPRWSSGFMGKQSALEGDLCQCKCDPAPVMRASQTSLFETFDANRSTSPASAAPDGAPANDPAHERYDQHFQLVDQDGAALDGVPVRIHTPTGDIVDTETDASGKTRKFPGLQGHTLGLSLFGGGHLG